MIKKRIISLLLALVMCSSLCTTALANEKKNECFGASVGDKFVYRNTYDIVNVNSKGEKEALLASKDYENGISDFILVEDGIITAKAILDRSKNTIVCSDIIDEEVVYDTIDLPNHVPAQNPMLAVNSYSSVGGIKYRYYDQGYAIGTRRIALSLSESSDPRSSYDLNGTFRNITGFVAYIVGALALPNIIASELAAMVFSYLGFAVSTTNVIIPPYYVDATKYQNKWELTYGSTTAYMTGWKYKFYHSRVGETQYAYDGNYYTQSNYTNHSASLANAVYQNMPLYWGGDGRVEVVSWG